jgi:Nif-specific regulatory protein
MESELFGHERGAFTGAEQRVLGKAELADGGTLFLDEIGDLKGSLQGKLLRLLQDREFERVGGRKTLSVDVRIVAATNRPLEAWVDSGQFRADLYYRLKVIELAMPSLRERGADDIERLGLHFVKLYAQKHNKLVRGLSTDALVRLRSHLWPGNIRELEHCIESAVALCPGPDITSSDLPLPSSLNGSIKLLHSDGKSADGRTLHGSDPDRSSGLQLPEGLSLADVEQRYIRHTLDRFAGNRSEAARALGIGRNTLLRKLKEE